MSKFDQELTARIASGEDLDKVALWYIHMIAKSDLPYADLSPFEQKFWDQLTSAFARWKRQRSLH
jgi:hypothetical protein